MGVMISALQRFNEIATSQFQDETRIGISRDGRLISVDEAGYFSRAKTMTVRGQSQTDENNAVRTALLDALKTQFGTNVPESVKAALKGSSLVGSGDMKTDQSGKVVSGRPLTMRRIKAVMTAVKTELTHMNTVSQADVLRELGNIETSGKAFVNKNGSNEWISHPSTEQFFTHIVNNAIKKAMFSGASGELVVNVVTNELERQYALQGSSNLRHYFPQLVSGENSSFNHKELKAAVTDFLLALGVDVNRPATAEHKSGIPELLFPTLPDVEVPAPEVNVPEVKAEPEPPEPKFLMPSIDSVLPAVDKRLANCPSKFQNETVLRRFSHFAHENIKKSIEGGVATRDGIAKNFSAWLKNSYKPLYNDVPAYLFPALKEPGVQNGFDMAPLRDQVLQFLDEIGLVAK